tara:strand:- start:605 stop:781 length:177 start_codon:yes stop_codon:yes gene_type:complete
MDIIKKMKKDTKKHDIIFQSLEQEYSYIQGYLVASNENVPPSIFVKNIRGESVFNNKY